MRYASILHSHLLPIQDYLDTLKVRRLAHVDVALPRIITLPFGSYHFLILDGHHRAAAACLRGENTIRSTIIETDDDLRTARRGACGQALAGISGLLDTYEREWRWVCANEGVESFHDLLLMNGLA